MSSISTGPDGVVSIVILSASCCVPGMAALDEQARRLVEQAVQETGVAANVTIMPATTAFYGGIPRPVMAEVISIFQSGRMPVPAILINGKPVAYGIPALEKLTAALLGASEANTKATNKEMTR